MPEPRRRNYSFRLIEVGWSVPSPTKEKKRKNLLELKKKKKEKRFLRKSMHSFLKAQTLACLLRHFIMISIKP